MKNRIIALLMVMAVLVLAFASCGGGNNTPTPDGGEQGGNSGETVTPDNLLTNDGKGLPEDDGSGVFDVDFTKGNYVQDVTDQGYYIDGCPTVGTPGVLVIPVDFKDVTAESKGYTIRNVRGVKIAFVAFTKGMNITIGVDKDKDSMTLPPGSEDCVNVLYTDYDGGYQEINKEKILSVLEAVNEEKPDLTVALLHWGSEYNNTISQSQKDIAELLQTNGVDAIIGTHSHYVQKMSFDAQSGQFVAYSLGDFFSNVEWSKKEEKYTVPSGSEYSVILDLEITKDNTTGETKITGFSYTPIYTVQENDQPMRVVRIQQAVEAYENGYYLKVSQETYEKMVYAKERIDARIKSE